MDAKQLQEAAILLKKAHEKDEPPSTILTLLQPLEKWAPTEDLMRSSKIGVYVNKCRNSKDPKVNALASNLVNKWKKAVQKKPGTASPAPGKGGVNGVNGTGRSGTSSPAPPVKKEAPPRKHSVAPEKRTAKEDGVNTGHTGNAVRDGCIMLIYNGLCFMSEESPDDVLAAATRVEEAAFQEYAPETSATYKQKMRSLHLNLKMKQNTELRKDVYSGAIDPKRFVTMTSDELKSEDQRKEIKKLEKENMNKAMTAVEEKAISTTALQ
ncbi:transcription elongation factor TFIIS [Saxophila tyrrhenica]|uniref:Transcription elongation factor TFIIS n=1 Tax=Saxophila tyrrhenica TaxID=1690608 RepID=A0AAV9PFC8_9PEZI|nr:transcription elongation factor TFIIS [Saxophila tyrrhenica]